jgi:membrane protein
VPTREATMRRARHAVDPEREGRLGVVTQTVVRYMQDGMPERAPALAYYGILSLFPALLIAFAVARFFAGENAAADIAAYSQEHGVSGAVSGAVRSAISTSQDASASTAGAVGVVGLATLIYGASRAFTAAGRAVDAIGHRSRRPRPLLRRAQDIGWTLVVLLIGMAVVLLATVSGQVLEDLLGLLGISGAAGTVWAILRWPAAAALVFLTVAIVRWAAPTGGRLPFRWLSPGRVATVVSLLVATGGFNVYVTHFASYNTTYGAFAGAIILMLWIWLAGSALLFGAELDAVLDERAARHDDIARDG